MANPTNPFYVPTHAPTALHAQALEKEAAEGGPMDQYEIEGPDRAELLADLAEFQLATVSHSTTNTLGNSLTTEWHLGAAKGWSCSSDWRTWRSSSWPG